MVSVLHFWQWLRLCSSNALDLIRKTRGSKLCRITRNENLNAPWFTSVSPKARRFAGKFFKCGVNPILFYILQHPTSLSVFGRFPGRPLSTRWLYCLRFIAVFFNFHKIMWYYIKAGHRKFLPHSFQFICLLFPYRLTLNACTCLPSWKCYNKLGRLASEAANVTLQFSKYVCLFEGRHFRP